MDMKKLLEPYSENGRTVEGQVAWLQKKGFNPTVIENALRAVYKRIEEGETFENGHALDRELLRMCGELSHIEAQILLKNMERFIEGGRFKKAWAALRGKL